MSQEQLQKSTFDRRHRLVAAAFWTLIFLALVVGFASILIIRSLEWERLLNLTARSAISDLRLAIDLPIFFFCISFPSGITMAIYRGYQESHKGNLWNIVGSICGLLCLLLITRFDGGLPFVVLAVMGPTATVRVINTAHLFFVDKPHLMPSPRIVRLVHFWELCTLGIYYLIQQLGNLGMFQIQPIILTCFEGPRAVGRFNIAYRLQALPQQMLVMFLSPLIGSYGEAK